MIRQHWVTFLATSILIASGTLVLSQSRYSQQIADLQAHVSLLSEQNATLRQNQAATPPSQWRRLSDRQRAQLLSALSAPENRINAMVVYAMASSEPRQFAAQFVDIFQAAGVQVFPREVPLTIPADIGLMVGVLDLNNPPEDAKRFLALLQRAGLSAHYTQWAKMPGEVSTVDFDLWVGPQPW